MLHKSVLAACKRAGIPVTEYPRTGHDGQPTSSEWVGHGKTHRIEWYASGPETRLGSVYVIRHGAQDDLMTDYWAGSFVRTVSRAVAWANGE